jgi:Xaa-Pro aminopeptidase
MHPVGEMPEALAKAYRSARQALQMAIEAVRPGLPAGELDRRMRDFVRRAGFEPYPHHSGHGIGTSYHEEPRVVPYNKDPFKPGMVLALEPGIYLPGVGGVRVEDVVLVTDDGAEVLTRHLARLG